MLKYPLYFQNLNHKALFFGSVYPDMFYADITFREVNFSRYIHTKSFKEIIDISKRLLNNSKTNYEKSFSLGFISHFFLDFKIHQYLEKIKYHNRVEHLSFEFYLDKYVLNTKKVVISKTPVKLLKKVFGNGRVNEKKVNFIPSFFKKKLFLFVCNYLLNETNNIYYLKNKKSNIFKKAFLFICFFPTLKSYKYDALKLFKPDFNLMKKYLPDLLSEYNDAKKEYLKFIKNYVDN